MQTFQEVILKYHGTEYCFDVTCDNSKDRLDVRSIDRVYQGHCEVYDAELIAEMNKSKALRRNISRYLEERIALTRDNDFLDRFLEE